MKNLILSFLIVGFITSCSPKTTAPATTSTTPVKVEDKNTPCATFADLSPLKKEQAENAFVTYKALLSDNKPAQALVEWRTAFRLAPKSNGSVKSHYDDGVKMFADLLKATSDKEQQSKYMDTIQQIYTKREECFGGDADYYGRKAFSYYYNLKDYVGEDEIYNIFKKAVELGNGKIDYFIINPFTRMVFDRVADEKITVAEAALYAKKILPAIKNGVTNCKGAECDSWAVVNEYAPTLLSTFEGYDGFYDCTYYTDKYYAIWEASPTDCEVINTAYSRMLRGGCSQTDAKLMAVQQAKQQNCYVAPPPPGTLKQAYDAYSSGKYKDAVQLFEQAAEETNDNDKKARYLMTIAKIYYGDLKNYPTSRSYARKAAALKSNWGEPYLLIGKLYASSGPLCGPGRGWDSQVVTWPAIDMFQQARSIDPSSADEANKFIGTYSKYMPNKEDIFSRGISVGSTYNVGCWIQESTRVRTSD